MHAKIKADIVHIHAVGPALMTPLVRLLGMKAVITHHGPDYDRDKWGKFAKWDTSYGRKNRNVLCQSYHRYF